MEHGGLAVVLGSLLVRVQHEFKTADTLTAHGAATNPRRFQTGWLAASQPGVGIEMDQLEGVAVRVVGVDGVVDGHGLRLA